MPNWVFNNVTVEGSPSSVQKLKEQMNKPYTREQENWDKDTYSMVFKTYTYSNPVFAFWNIIAPTDMVEYAKQPSFVQDEKADRSDLSWYTWNINNWGVKWDVGIADTDPYPDTELISEFSNGENTVLLYTFNTAWGCPIQALTELSSQFPDLLITNEYQEEQGWGGEDEFLRGQFNEGHFYVWRCSDCDHDVSNESERPYCEECQEDVCPECLYSNAVQEDLCKEHNVSQRP